jgi:hypothetical protein
MTKAQHQFAVDNAIDTAHRLNYELQGLGSRGQTMTGISGIYEDFRLTAGGLLWDKERFFAAQRSFQSRVKSFVTEAFQGAIDAGFESAEVQTEIYGLRQPTDKRGFVRPSHIAMGIDTATNFVQTQLNQANLQFQIGNTDPTVVLGTTYQPRHLNQYSLIKELSAWIPALLLLAWDTYVDHAIRGPNRTPFVKQAIALLDGRTTETCFGAHGQTVPVNEPFELGGEFPGSKMYPPFHYWCRTTTALVLEADALDAITMAMLAAAIAEAKKRATKNKN